MNFALGAFFSVIRDWKYYGFFMMLYSTNFHQLGITLKLEACSENIKSVLFLYSFSKRIDHTLLH